jgi:hypothetical protein
MKGRSTLVLLGLIAALGVFIWMQESWRARTKGQEERSFKLFDVDARTLSSLEFRLTNDVVLCEKESGLWMVGNPEQGKGRADLALVYGMIANLNKLEKETVITAKQLKMRGLDASEYGFSPASAEIIAIDNQGRHTWYIGRLAPLGDMVYVMQEGRDDVFTVSSDLLSWLPERADVLRDRVLFPVDSGGVSRVEIRGSSGYIRLVKEDSSGWGIQQPIEARADPQEVDFFIRSLYELRVDEFVADNVSDLSVYGLQGETLQISLGSSDGSARTLLLGDEIPDRAGFVHARMANDTSVFAMPSMVLQKLEVPVNRFRDVRVLTIAPDKVSSISIRRGEEKLDMEADSVGAWTITDPVAWEADREAVQNFINLWEHAVITEFTVEPQPAEVEWSVSFSSADSGVTNRIEIMEEDDRQDGLLIRRAEDPNLVQINLPELPPSIINPLIYKDRHLWRLRKNDISKLAVTKHPETRQVVERGEDGVFTATGSSTHLPVNAAAVDSMISQLADMETPSYIAHNPRNLDVYGLAEPSLELHIGLADTNELGRILLVGREAPEGFYSMVKGRDVVFYLDKETVDTLSADLVDRPRATDSTTGSD